MVAIQHKGTTVASIFEIGSYFSKYQMWQLGRFSKIMSYIYIYVYIYVYIQYIYVCIYVYAYVTGFVKVDPNHTGTEIHFIAEH